MSVSRSDPSTTFKTNQNPGRPSSSLPERSLSAGFSSAPENKTCSVPPESQRHRPSGSTYMTYTEKIAALRATGDIKAVLDFLEQIFCAPENQSISGSPSEYLSAEDGEDTLPPSEVFATFVEGFQPAAVAKKAAF